MDLKDGIYGRTFVGDNNPVVTYHGRKYDHNYLMFAAIRGDFYGVTKGLKYGLDINHPRWLKCPPTSVPSLPAGARTLLEIVAARMTTSMLRTLLETDADITGSKVRAFVEQEGEALLRYYTTAELENKDFRKWSTPLHITARCGNSGNMQMLLKHGCDANVKDSYGRTALFEAVASMASTPENMSRLFTCVKLLVSSGTDIHNADDAGDTVLMMATRVEHMEICQLLIDRGADPDWMNSEGETAASIAGSLGNRDIFQMYLGVGGSAESCLHIYGASRAFAVLASKRPDQLRSALVNASADMDIDNVDDSGMSAFFRAASYCDCDAVRALADLGADVEGRDSNGCTVLMRAAMAGNPNLLATMLDLGADINATDVDGWTPLDAAMLREDGAAAKQLLPHGAIPGARRSGEGLLHSAAALGSSYVVRYILERYRGIEPPVDLDPVDENGITPLAMAASYDNHAVLRLLITNTADPLRPDNKGYTPIERALYFGSVSSVRILLGHGALLGDRAILALQFGAHDFPSNRASYDLITRNLRSRDITVDLYARPEVSNEFAEDFRRDFDVNMMRIRMLEKQGKVESEYEVLQRISGGGIHAATPSKDPFERHREPGTVWVEGLSSVL